MLYSDFVLVESYLVTGKISFILLDVWDACGTLSKVLLFSIFFTQVFYKNGNTRVRGKKKGSLCLQNNWSISPSVVFVECLLIKIVQWKTVEENAVDSVEEGWTRMHNFFPCWTTLVFEPAWIIHGNVERKKKYGKLALPNVWKAA